MPNKEGRQTAAQPPAQNPPTTHDWETANSTSRLFLGATRRLWMTGPDAPPAVIQATRPRYDPRPPRSARPRGRPRKYSRVSAPIIPPTDASLDVRATSLHVKSAQPAEINANPPIIPKSSPSVTMIDENHEAEETPARAIGSLADVATFVYDQALPAAISTRLQVEQSPHAQPGDTDPQSEQMQAEEPLVVQNAVAEQRYKSVQDQKSNSERHRSELRQVDPVHFLHKASSAGAMPPGLTPTTSCDGFRPPEPLRFPAARTTSPQTRVSGITRAPPFSARNANQPVEESGSNGAISSNSPRMRPVRGPSSDDHLGKRPFNQFQDDSGTRRSSPNPVQLQNSPALPIELPSRLNPYSKHLANVMVSVRSQTRLRDVDEQRVILLQEACLIEDVHYLVLHQIYCMKQSQAALLQRFQIGPEEYAGFRVLEWILVPNDEINSVLLTAFSNFPRGFHASVRATDLINQTKVFLKALAKRWNSIREVCLTRGYPKCAHELEIELSVQSPIMQKTLFNSLHRQIGGNASPIWQSRAMQLFLQNQRDFVRLSSQDSRAGYIAQLQNTDAFGQKYVKARNTFAAPAPVSIPVISPAARSNRPGAAAQDGRPRTRVPQNQPNTAHSAHQQSSEQCTNPRFILQPQPTTVPSQNLSASISSVTSFLGLAAQNRRLHTTQQTQVQHPQQSNVQHAPSGNVSPQARLPAAPPLLVQNHVLPEDLLPNNLLPRHGHQMILTSHPNPDLLALHQAHLRDPEFKKIDSQRREVQDLRVYQFVENYSFISGPFTNETTVVQAHFDISQAEVRDLIQHEPPRDSLSARGRRIYTWGAMIFRVRCSTTEDPSQIGVRPVTWPACFFMSLNAEPDLQVRRRSHWGRDLPVDITRFIQTGQNSLTVSYHPTVEEKRKKHYFVVERVRVCGHKFAKHQASRLSTDKALAFLTSVLRVHQDDDLAFADPHVSIDLIDPFMATIWQTPVRGKECKHRECFDHEAFLQSRPSYLKGKEHSNGPTDPDRWACPICGLDARPASLVIDEFLLQVRAYLETEGKLGDAKAILLMEDGTWEVKKGTDLDGKGGTTVNRKPTPAAASVDAMDVDNTTGNGSKTAIPARSTPTAGTASEPISLVLDDEIDDDV